jgi:DNA-binding PadR family transcriptional regulator
VDLSILDLYILSLLDRGLRSKYELQRQGGVSLGSSVPSLRRLEKAKLIVRRVGSSIGDRPRHDLRLSPAGRRAVRGGWQTLLDDSADKDLDSILRIVDMARSYSANKSAIAGYLNSAASGRRRTAAGPEESNSGGLDTAAALQERWASARASAEAKFLTDLAKTHSPGPGRS